MADEVELLSRAHALFSGAADPRPLDGGSPGYSPSHSPGHTGMTAAAHRQAASSRSADLVAARGVDDEFARLGRLERQLLDHQRFIECAADGSLHVITFNSFVYDVVGGRTRAP